MEEEQPFGFATVWPTTTQIESIWPTTTLTTVTDTTIEIHSSWPSGTLSCPGCMGNNVMRGVSQLRCLRCRQDWDLTQPTPVVLRAKRQEELDALRRQRSDPKYQEKQQEEYAAYARAHRILPEETGWNKDWEMFYWKPRDCVCCPRCKCQDTSRHLADVNGIKDVPMVRCPRCRRDWDLSKPPPRDLIKIHKESEAMIQNFYAQNNQFGD